MSSLHLPMPPAARRMPPEARSVLLAGVGAAVLGAVLAGLGMPALYTVLGVIVLLVVGRLLRGQVLTPLYAAWSALPIHRSTTTRPIHRSGLAAQPRAGLPRPPATRWAVALTAAASATVAVLAGLAGVRGIAVVLALLLLVVTAPRLATWVRPWVRPRLGSWLGASLGVGGAGGEGGEGGEAVGHRRGWLVLPVGAAVAAVGWVAAGMGGKGLLVAVGAVAIGTILWVVRDRHTVLLFLAAATVAVMMHKSFTDPDLQQSGGAVSIYVTTLDVVVVLLYLLWWRSGTLTRISPRRRGAGSSGRSPAGRCWPCRACSAPRVSGTLRPSCAGWRGCSSCSPTSRCGSRPGATCLPSSVGWGRSRCSSSSSSSCSGAPAACSG